MRAHPPIFAPRRLHLPPPSSPASPPHACTRQVFFISAFAGVYGGMVHPAGFLQATHSLAGFEQGICVVFPPPPVLGVAGTPFKLYYGFEHHPWCSALALHFIFMSFVGWYFLHLLKLDGRENKGSGLRFWQTPRASARMLHWRAGLVLLVGGLGHVGPYLSSAVLDRDTDFVISDLLHPGGYSKRSFTPALTENLAAWSWLIGGLYHLFKAKSTATAASASPALPIYRLRRV